MVNKRWSQDINTLLFLHSFLNTHKLYIPLIQRIYIYMHVLYIYICIKILFQGKGSNVFSIQC